MPSVPVRFDVPDEKVQKTVAGMICHSAIETPIDEALEAQGLDVKFHYDQCYDNGKMYSEPIIVVKVERLWHD